MFEETYTSGEQILKVETRRLHGVRTCQRPLCASRASAHKRERGGSWAGLWICCVPASDKVHPSGLSFSYVQLLSRVRLFVTPRAAARQASLSLTNSQSSLKLMSIELVMPSNHLILCHPLLLLPSIFPSIRVFYNESVLCIRWPKHWSFHFSISPSNEYSALISLRMDRFDLTVQRNLKRLLQHHNSKASILWCSAFFMICTRLLEKL